MIRFTLRQLQVFLAVAKHEHISKAAQQLAMSQSAVSSALKELESHYPAPLFERAGKRLHLSQTGHLLQPMAQSLLDQAQSIDHTLRQPGDLGLLRVGATLTIGNYLAAELIAQYLDMPKATTDSDTQPSATAQVHLSIANTQTVVDQIAHFTLDIGLIEGEVHHPDLLIMPWLHDELQVFCAPQHPYAQRQQLDDAALLGATWIIREPGSGTRQAFEQAMTGLMPQLTLGLQLQQTEAIKRAVTARLGLGCLSRRAIEEECQQGKLIALAVPQRQFKRQFCIVLHKHKYQGAALKRWLMLCQQQLSAS